MVLESDFLDSLNDKLKQLYLDHEFNEDLDDLMKNNLTNRQYASFEQLQVPSFPRFLENVFDAEQKSRFRLFIKSNRIAVTDAWLKNSPENNKYIVWKNRYLASKAPNVQNGPVSPSSTIRPPMQRKPSSISITFPTRIIGYVRGKKDVTLNRIIANTQTRLTVLQGTPNSQIVVSPESPDKMLHACKEVWSILALHQKSIHRDNDIQLFKYLSRWSNEHKIQFQNQYKSSVKWFYSDSKYVIEVRSWINADNKIAVQKLKELQKANQLPPKLLPDRIAGFVQQETQQPELDHLPNCTNILILGETGVGKSTFINGMVNYLTYNKIARAEQFGPAVLVPSRFTLFDNDGKEWDIAVKPKDSPHWDKNEAKDVGESATQKPMSYTFSLPGKREKYIRIIDTPGIGDTRGINQDEMNFEEIMSYIADYPKIHAILFLVAPNEARLKVSFRYGIQELLARLHRTAVDNVIFCFTKSRGNQYKAGESYPILQSLLTKLGERGSAVHLNKETSYFFDSESFRYLAAKKQGFTFTDIEHRDYKESWQKAVNETQRLFKYIFTLQPHDVNETLCVNNTKKVIQMLSKPLGDITKNILANESLLNDKKKAVEHMIKAGDDLQNKLFVEQIVLEAEELKNPQTVCTAQSCVEHGTVGGKTHTTIYKTICDPDCGHTGIQAEVLPNPNLSDCKAFENGKCKKCGCNWELHMHIRSRTNQVTISVMDDKVQKDITANLTKKEEADSFIRFLVIKIKEETNHKETILEHCAEFAAFVAQNSMLAVNDAYNEYLKYLIKEEKDKENSSDSLILAELERYAHAYEEQSKLLISARKTKRSEQKTVDDINKMINDLKESDFCGSFLEEIQYLQVVSVRTSAKNRSKKIVLTNWKEDLKWLLEKPVKKTKKFLN